MYLFLFSSSFPLLLCEEIITRMTAFMPQQKIKDREGNYHFVVDSETTKYDTFSTHPLLPHMRTALGSNGIRSLLVGF